MVVVLSRGLYCPKDRRQAMELVRFEPELKVGYTKLVTISTDDLLATNENRDGLGAHWPFLSDPGRIVQKDLDIQEYTDPVHNPMVPHTLVLAPELRVHSIYNGHWYWGRPSVEELRHDLRAATWMQAGQSARAIDSARLRCAPLAEEKDADRAPPFREAVAPTNTMLPRPARFIAGMTCLDARRAPSAFTRQAPSKSAAVASSTLPQTPEPAL